MPSPLPTALIPTGLLLGLLLVPARAQATDGTSLAARLEAIQDQRLTSDAPSIPAEALDKALAGKLVSGVEFVEGAKAGKGWGLAVYDLPVDAVWKAVNDDEGQAGRLPISVSAVIGGDQYQSGRDLFQYMPLPIVADRWWVVRVKHNADLFAASDGAIWEQAWDDVTSPDKLADTAFSELIQEGIPVEFTTGAWLLVALEDERTLASYFSWSDPGGRIPAGPASRFAGGAVKDTLEAMGELAADHAAKERATGFVKPDGTPL